MKTKVKSKRKQKQTQKTIPPAMGSILKSILPFQCFLIFKFFLQYIQDNKYLRYIITMCYALRIK